MIQSIDRILEYVEGMDYESFKNDQKTIDAVIRNFEIIGEASKNIPKNVHESNPEVPWQEMYLMRNMVSHEYFGVDTLILWEVINKHLPANRVQLKRILSEIQ
jgi:uncharacterized protein with HEPN domain